MPLKAEIICTNCDAEQFEGDTYYEFPQIGNWCDMCVNDCAKFVE